MDDTHPNPRKRRVCNQDPMDSGDGLSTQTIFLKEESEGVSTTESLILAQDERWRRA